MFRENVVRYFLLMRHVFTYTPALFSHKRKTCTNKFDFLLLSIPIGNYQKLSETRPETRRHGVLLPFLSKSVYVLLTIQLSVETILK